MSMEGLVHICPGCPNFTEAEVAELRALLETAAGLQSTNPLPLVLDPWNPTLILNTPIMWYIRIYRKYLLLGGWEGFL